MYIEHETETVKLRKMSWVSSFQSIIDNKISLDPISFQKKSIYVTVMDEAVLRHLQSRLVGRGSQHK